MNTTVGWRKDIKTPYGISRHEVLKAVMKVAQKNMAKQKSNGVKFKQIADHIGISDRKISDVYRGRYISKNTIRLLIGYGYLKIDDVLPHISKDQIRIMKTIIPEWA
jgi:hypothetical protein